MKKMGVIGGIISILFLSGCFHSTAARIVTDMYQAALGMDKELVESYFSEDYKEDNEPFTEVVEKLNVDVVNRQGVHLMHITELTSSQLTEEAVQALNEDYQGEWSLVVAQIDEDSLMAWIVQRGETQYYIMDGKEISNKEFNDILRKDTLRKGG
ncbi:hypothetical protein D8M04_06260 [Oceanobacillus piezotolerans]|uniref:Uncharacterized protein n=1 Tax=Oceanobacillus piezotolerans TaxID=2448030 RepID=A0A498DFS7_9BACI|nr:hypothetical protein [Oceanobacillus piezotolerans]RLL46801.1 hypothetical protein D8M04_06260 [Oceanobacillus piezotolerans]